MVERVSIDPAVHQLPNLVQAKRFFEHARRFNASNPESIEEADKYFEKAIFVLVRHAQRGIREQMEVQRALMSRARREALTSPLRALKLSEAAVEVSMLRKDGSQALISAARNLHGKMQEHFNMKLLRVSGL